MFITPEWLKLLESGPASVEWNHGPIPPVEDVAFDCRIVLVSESYIGLVAPFGDKLNPLRWGDHGSFPTWGTDRPSGWWIWLSEGSAPRPPGVETWAEFSARADAEWKAVEWVTTLRELSSSTGATIPVGARVRLLPDKSPIGSSRLADRGRWIAETTDGMTVELREGLDFATRGS